MSSAGQGALLCQFSGEACSTQSTYYRKVISHIFGRNKKCTIGIPDYVWIYYCRKHYQRARYRTGEWPFRQCDLAMDTVRNMQAWGGVESFNIQLRRRETKRTSGGDNTTNEDGQSTNRTATSTSQTPQPADNESPDGETTDPGSPSQTPCPSLPAENEPATVNHDNADEHEREETTPTPHASVEAPESSKKKRPTITPRPVPDWLHSRIGARKSFTEVLDLMRDLRRHLLRMSEHNERPHFPDIEILPNLRPRAAVDKSKNKNKSKVKTRVSAKGAVKKIEKQKK